MPKVKISEYSQTAANNTDINSINLAEGMLPSDVNNAIRELMKQLKDFQVGAQGDPVTVGGNLVVSGTSNLIGTTSITGVLSSGTYTGRLKAYTEEVTTATVSTSTYNIDTSVSNIFDITLGNNVTFTFTNPPSSGIARSVTVILRQDGTGSRTATFTNAYYSSGAAPTLSTGANDIDVLSFFTVNGGTFWFGTFAMADVS